jgi:hypothetical protein
MMYQPYKYSNLLVLDNQEKSLENFLCDASMTLSKRELQRHYFLFQENPHLFLISRKSSFISYFKKILIYFLFPRVIMDVH